MHRRSILTAIVSSLATCWASRAQAYVDREFQTHTVERFTGSDGKKYRVVTIEFDKDVDTVVILRDGCGERCQQIVVYDKDEWLKNKEGFLV